MTSTKLETAKWKTNTIENYLVSSDAHVYHRDTMREITIRCNSRWNFMLTVDLYHNNQWKTFRLDYLVAYTFKGYPDDIMRLIHIDDNIRNCTLDNLMWLRKIDIIDKYKDLYQVDELTEITEEWKPYPLIIYGRPIEISNYGNVRDVNTKEQIKPTVDHDYLTFHDRGKTYLVHRLVAELFVPNPKPDEYKIVNHIDGNKQNPVFWNLEWCNVSMNTEHGYNQAEVEKVSDQTVHTICKLLADNVDRNQISLITGTSKKYISKIATGYRRSDISSQYTFPERISMDEKFGRDRIVKLILEGKGAKEISELLQIEHNMQFISYCYSLKVQHGLR